MAKWNDDRTKFDRNLAVVIGINAYGNGVHPLKTPVNDAMRFADLLEQQYEYKKESNYQVIRLFDTDATLDRINQLLFTDLPKQIKPTEGDRLLFYFAGHGISSRDGKEGPTGYLIPQDAKLTDIKTFLPMRQLYKAFKRLNCHHLLVILDCCHAGMFRTATRQLIPLPERLHREHYDRFIRYSAWQVIVSAASDQEAQDQVALNLLTDNRGIDPASEQVKHSPFAMALIKGLSSQEADYSGDGVITIPELYLYLDKYVNQWSKEQQKPGFWSMRPDYDRGEYIFTIQGFNPNTQLEPAPALDEANNPYRGLKPFEERHANLFFGRQKLIEELSNRLAKSRCPLTVVLGTSGSGKSSLVKAGLLPYLRQQREESKKQDKAEAIWCILTPMRPGKSPFAELAKAVLPVVNYKLVDRLKKMSFLDDKITAILDPKSGQKQKSREHTSREKGDDAIQLAEQWYQASSEAKLLLVVDYFNVLEELFRDQPQAHTKLSRLHDAINRTLKPRAQTLQQQSEFFNAAIARWKQKHPKTKLLLVIDQFEELITLSQDKQGQEESDSKEQQEWQKFLSLLGSALDIHQHQLHIVVTIRSDFEPRFLDSALKKHWKDARFPVRAMNSDELREAIEGPALKQALYFEPAGLVGHLIDEVGQMPGALPLLSFTLSELYIKLYERWKPGSTDRALRIEDYQQLDGVAGALTHRATDQYQTLDEEQQATVKRIMLRMVALDGAGIARRRVPESELEYPNPEENERVQQVIDQFVNVRLLVKGQQDGEPYVEPAHDLLVRGWSLLQEWIDQEQENLLLQQRLTVAAVDWKKSKDKGALWKEEDLRIKSLEEVTQSENNWLNKLELDFFQACIREGLEREVDLNTKDSQRLFMADDRLDAIVKMIETGEQLQRNFQKGLKINAHKQLYFMIQFNHLLSELGETNSIEIGDQVNNFICNQKGQVIVTLSGRNSNKICFWNWQGKQIGSAENEEEIYDLALSPDGEILVTGGANGIIKFYRGDRKSWHSFSQIQGDARKHRGHVKCVKFSPDGNILISASNDGQINFWDRQGSFIMTLFTHKQPVRQLVVNPQINLIAFTHDPWDKAIKKSIIHLLKYQVPQDTEHPACSKVDHFFDAEHEGNISAIDFSPDGKTLVSSGRDGKLQIWTIREDLSEPRLYASRVYKRSISHVAFSPDGKIVASSHSNGIINFSDLSLATEDYFNLQQSHQLAGHKEEITKISFTSDSSQLLSSSYDGTVKLWSFKDRFAGHPGARVQKIGFSIDNQIVTTLDKKRNLKLWNPDGELRNQFDSKIKIHDAQLSRDNKIVVAIGSDGEVNLYSLDGRMLFTSTQNHQQPINHLSLSPMADIFVTTGEDSRIGLWQIHRDPYSLKLLKIFDPSKAFADHHGQITAIAFSADGQFFASGSDDGKVALWSSDSDASQTPETSFEVGGSIVHLSLSHDGQMIGLVINSTNDEHEIKLCSRNHSPQSLCKNLCRKTTGRIYALSVCCEDEMIVAISETNRIGYIESWNVDGTWQKGIPALDKQGFDIKAETAAFSANGKAIAIATYVDNDSDGYRSIQTVNLDLDSLIGTARERIQDYLALKDFSTPLSYEV